MRAGCVFSRPAPAAGSATEARPRAWARARRPPPAQPLVEIGKRLVLRHHGHALQRRGLGVQRSRSPLPALLKVRSRMPDTRRRWRHRAAAAAPSSAVATSAMLRGSVWMCGLPAGVHVTLRAVDLGRHFELAHEIGGREVAGCPGWILALPDCCSSTGSQPALELGAGAHQQIGIARARDQARPRLDLSAGPAAPSWPPTLRPAARRAPAPARPIRARRPAPAARRARLHCTEPRCSDEHHREWSAVHLNVLRRRISQSCESQSIDSCGMFRSHAHHARPGSSGTGQHLVVGDVLPPGRARTAAACGELAGAEVDHPALAARPVVPFASTAALPA